MKANEAGHGELTDKKLESLAYAPKGGESFPAVGGSETETVKVVSYNSDLELVKLCYNVVSRISRFLPEDEGKKLKDRLEGAKTTDQLALLAVQTAQNEQLVNTALNASNKDWLNQYPGMDVARLKNNFINEIADVLALVK